MNDTATVLVSLAAIVISLSSLFIARRNYRRTKAHLATVEARYPHLAEDTRK